MSDLRLLAKCAWRLIPFMGLLYLVNYVDRVNAGFAALTMNKDLGFSPSVFGFGAGIFFAGYLLFQIPSNVILERIGTRISICCIMAAWALFRPRRRSCIRRIDSRLSTERPFGPSAPREPVLQRLRTTDHA